MMLRLKQMLIGTLPGQAIESTRDALAICRAMLRAPEQGSRLFQHWCGTILLSSLCEPGRVFVDVGAHIGSVIGRVLRANPDIDAIAVEADPDKAAWLKRKFPKARIHACAVGATQGEVEFRVNLARPGFSSLASSRGQAERARTIRVPMHRLDDLCSGEDRVGVIKIDVEGMELAVLEGASNVVSRSRPAIYFESGPRGKLNFGFTADQLFDWFEQRNYQILVPNRIAHDGIALGRAGFSESHVYPQRTLNYFAIPIERRADIRDRAREILGVRSSA